MFAPARFPALALPEDVGGMLLDDGGVEVACTPLHAVASVARHDVVGAPPRELCVFGVVDAVKIFDGGGDDESRARLVVDLRSGPAPTDRCERVLRRRGACPRSAAPGAAPSRRRRGGSADGGYGVVYARRGCRRGGRRRDAAAAEAAARAWRPDWTAEQCAARRRRSPGPARAARSARGRRERAGDDVRERCWLCALGRRRGAAATRSARRPALRRAAPGRAEPARGRARLRRRARAGARAVPVAVFAAAARRAARCY